MDLWIRSQAKETLVKCNCIDIMWVEGRPNIFINGKFPDYIVANYTTRERALEVIDEIQELILNSSKIYVESSCLSPVKPKDQKYIKELVKGDTPILDERLKIKTTNIDTVVYEMPLE